MARMLQIMLVVGIVYHALNIALIIADLHFKFEPVSFHHIKFYTKGMTCHADNVTGHEYPSYDKYTTIKLLLAFLTEIIGQNHI